MLGKVEKILIANKEFIVDDGDIRGYIQDILSFVDKIYLMDNGDIILEGYTGERTKTYKNINDQIKNIESSYYMNTHQWLLKGFINYLNMVKEKLK